MLTQTAVTSKAIRINVKLTTAQVQTLRNRMIELFPQIAALHSQRKVQMVNACGQFRIIPLCGTKLPTCLTEQLVGRMIVKIQAEDETAVSGGDPVLAAWYVDGAPVSGAKWDGDYSGVLGNGEMRLTLAAN